MKKTLAAALAACLFLTGTVFALPAELSEAVRLFVYDGQTVYGLFDPKEDSTTLYTLRGETASRLCKIENSGISTDDYAVLGDKAYCCFRDPSASETMRLMRIGMRDGIVAKAAEFQSPNTAVYLEPAGEKLLLYNRRDQPHIADGTGENTVSLYDPVTGVLKPVVELTPSGGEELVITAATYDQGAIFALVERVMGGKITYTLRKFGMDGASLDETAIPTALAAPGGRGAAELSVSGDYATVNNAAFSVLFRRSTGKALYDGPRLTIDGENAYTDPLGARFRLDMTAGRLTKIEEASKAGDTVEAYMVMVSTLTHYNSELVSPKLLAFDTTHMAFAEGEKEQFFARLRAVFPKSHIVDGTLDDLEKMGYASGDGAFRSVKWGTLVTIQDVTFTGDTVKFSINNYVSGRAGYRIGGAELQKKNGVWTVINKGLQGIS